MPSRVQASYSRPTLPGWYARAGLPKTAFAASAAVSSPAPASRAPVGEASAGGNGTGDATATVVVAFAGAGRAADTSHSLPEGGGGGRDTVDGAASPPGPDAPERPAAGRPDAPRSRLGCLRHGTCAAEVAAGESSILERLAKAPCEPTRNGSSGRARKQARLRRQAGRERRVPTVAAGCLRRPLLSSFPHCRHVVTWSEKAPDRNVLRGGLSSGLPCIDAAAPRLHYGGLTRASATLSSASFPAACAAPCESRRVIA